jgi:ubiquinone/menaquinone biosynthesis C-methylase UbiE
MIDNPNDRDFIAGNYFNKYDSGNFVHRWLVDGFLRNALQLFNRANPRSVIEVGCADGDLASRLINCCSISHSEVHYVGVDISVEQVKLARRKHPMLEFQTASAYELPFANNSADLVMLCEVLEHTAHPSVAFAEAVRVSREHVLVSVPWEPVWRILNVLRGAYWRKGGNTPGHVQNFSRRDIRVLVSSDTQIVAERSPLPWTMLLVKCLPRTF